MSRTTSGRLAFRLALRDWRGGGGRFGGMGIVLLCLVLGVAAIGTIGGLRDAIQQGVAAQRRAILGGDLSFENNQPLPGGLAGFLQARGARTSSALRLRSMAYGAGSRRMLVELAAVDGSYPLVGEATVSGGGTLAGALATRDGLPGLAADPLVAVRLGVAPGGMVRIGTTRFRMVRPLDKVPDAAGQTALAPIAMIARPVLDATGLVQPGTLLTAILRATLPPGPPGETQAARLVRARALAAAAARAFPADSWHVRTIDDAAPALTRAVDQVAQFMTLIALAALLLGGMGVAVGVSGWLRSRVATVAVLRAVGAPPGLAGAVVGLQVAVLCLCGIALGTVAGLALPPLAVWLLGGLLPVAPDPGLHAGPVALAAGFGLLVALLFVLAPLSRALSAPPSVLFREPAGTGAAAASPRRRLVVFAAVSGLAVLLALLAVLGAPDRRLALGFCVVSGLVLGVFRLAGLAMVAAARIVPRPGSGPGAGRIAVRLALAALGRPGTPALRLLLGLGAGLTVLATVALAEGDLRASLLDQLPRHAPSFYFIDIQPGEMDRFRSVLRGQPAAGEVRALPSLRTRVVAVDGVPAERVAASAATRWALRGDHGLTLSGPMPAGTELAAGRWWPADHDGQPLLSLDAGLAAGWNVHVGSTIRLNVLGRDIDLRVASLRRVAWRSLQLNFAFVASPGLLSAAPHGMVATVASTGRPSDDAAILAAVTDALPNVSGIRVADILAQIAAIVGRLAGALAVIGGVALLAGALVLAATLAAVQRERVAEAAVLRALGATSRQLRLAWLIEFAVLGGVAGLCAAGIGSALDWLLMRVVLKAPFVLLPGTLLSVAGASIGLMLVAGYLATRRAVGARPAILLRGE